MPLLPCLAPLVKKLKWIPCVFGAVALSGMGSAAIAQTSSETAAAPNHEVMFEKLLNVPSNYSADFNFGTEPDSNWPVLRSRDTSLYRPTSPSLWWSRDQLPNRWRGPNQSNLRVEGYRLVRDWTSFHSQTADTFVIDIQVDPQYWNRFNYFQQYAILNQFGTAGMSYGYHVRVYSSISLVGVHACDFSQVPELAEMPKREVPVPNLSDVNCSAAIGPFIDYSNPAFGDDLFAPP